VGILGPATLIAARQKRITFQNPGTLTPDGDGGYTQAFDDLSVGADAQVATATAQTLERLAAGTVLSMATHVVTLPYRPDLTTQTRVLMDGRVLNVLTVVDPDERHVETVLVCAEVVS
jgi:SPP1 family predicted phage head-tail adaptor